jgi:hypothetical protein
VRRRSPKKSSGKEVTFHYLKIIIRKSSPEIFIGG